MSAPVFNRRLTTEQYPYTISVRASEVQAANSDCMDGVPSDVVTSAISIFYWFTSDLINPRDGLSFKYSRIRVRIGIPIAQWAVEGDLRRGRNHSFR